MSVNIGPKIGIDGEAEFRKELNNIIQQSKTLASEMKAVTSAFDTNDKSQEKLTAQSAVLTKQITNQKERIEQLKQGLQESANKFGEADTKTQKWQQAVNEATAELNKMERELEGLPDEFEEAGNAGNTFADVLKANLLSNIIIEGMKKIADCAKDMAGDFLDAAAEVKAETSQFEQTFKEFSDEATEAIGRVADNSGILDTRLNTLGSSIYAFAKSSGGDAQESLQLMETALQASADGAAYYDKSLEETTESLQSFLKGNYSNDAALGVSCTETTRNAAAMELFGKKFKDLTEIQKQQTLLQMVVDAQKLSGAYGQAAREADGWENVQGNLNEVWRQFMANVGTPFLENLIPIIQEITTSMQEWMNGVDWESFNNHVTNFVNAIKENGSEIVSLIAAIGAGFVAWNVASIISGVVQNIKSFQKANEGATIAQAALNAVMNANPIGIIVTLLAAVTAGLIVLWNTNEDFRNAVIEIWGKIKEAVSSVVNSIVTFFTQTVPNGISKLQTSFDNLKSGISQKVGEIKTKIVSGIGNAVDWIKSLPAQAKTWGKDMIQGFIQGIESKVSGIINSVKGIAGTIKSYLHFSRPDTGPLRDYETWMPDMIEGMINGINSSKGKLESAVQSLSAGMVLDVSASGSRSISGQSQIMNPVFHIYPSAGMDEQEIAQKVAEEMENLYARRMAVFS